MKVSCVVLTKDEEKNIEDCLASLAFCQEKIVIDDESKDNTLEIAKKMGARVFQHELLEDFAAARNYGMSKTSYEWVLFVDADERVSETLAYEIANLQIRDETSGFYVRRIDFMWGKELRHGEIGNAKRLRLAKKHSGAWAGRVHEKWQVEGNIGLLQGVLFHYPHQTIKEFLHEINFYTDLRAKELYEQKQKVSWWSIIFYPKAKFFTNYILEMGMLDGIPGFLHGMMMAFHSFLVRGKLWQLWQRKDT